MRSAVALVKKEKGRERNNRIGKNSHDLCK